MNSQGKRKQRSVHRELIRQKNCPAGSLSLENLQADFLQAGLDLQREDVLVSKEIFELERNLARLASGEEMAEGERRWEMLCPACTGIGPENCRKCLADCFEITGFSCPVTQWPGCDPASCAQKQIKKAGTGASRR